MLEFSQEYDFFFPSASWCGRYIPEHETLATKAEWKLVCVCAARVEGTHTSALLLLSFQLEQKSNEGTRIAINS